MSSINPETVVSVLKDQIENYDQKTEVKEEGRIIQIADGIATVYGMDQAMYGELVVFETGVHGLVLNVERNCIGCVLLHNIFLTHNNILSPYYINCSLYVTVQSQAKFQKTSIKCLHF